MPKIRIKEPHLDTQTFSLKLNRKLINIGRHKECMITLENDSISAEHAVIKRVSGGFSLCDQDSTNGTKIEGKRYTTIDLNRTRHFNLGDVQVSFLLSPEELAELKQESFEFKEELKEKIEAGLEDEAKDTEKGELDSNSSQKKEDKEISEEEEKKEEISSRKHSRRAKKSNQGELSDLALTALSFGITLGVLFLLFYLIGSS